MNLMIYTFEENTFRYSTTKKNDCFEAQRKLMLLSN